MPDNGTPKKTALEVAQSATAEQLIRARHIAAAEFKLFPEAVPIPVLLEITHVLAINHQSAILREQLNALADSPRAPDEPQSTDDY